MDGELTSEEVGAVAGATGGGLASRPDQPTPDLAKPDLPTSDLPKSDLLVRTASAIVMLAVAGLALALGGYFWGAFVALVAGGSLWEWSKLSRGQTDGPLGQTTWFFAGVLYIGVAAEMLLMLRLEAWPLVLLVVLVVVGTDIGAYFAGRTIGGAKIAPKISPNKTWAGLAGGMVVAALVAAGFLQVALCGRPEFLGGTISPFSVCHSERFWQMRMAVASYGAVMAVVAQAGDFLESWMKRRAGVKDSGRIIPGHGGLLDRVDGLLAVLFVLGLMQAVAMADRQAPQSITISHVGQKVVIDNGKPN